MIESIAVSLCARSDRARTNRLRRFSSIALMAFALGATSYVPSALAQKTEWQSGVLQYSYPVNNSSNVARETSIIIRPGDYLLASTVTSNVFVVTGTMSGVHTGSVVLSSDRKTVIFRPYKTFSYSERVTVHLNRGLKTMHGAIVDSTTFSFKIAAAPRRSASSIALDTASPGSSSVVATAPVSSDEQSTVAPITDASNDANLGTVTLTSSAVVHSSSEVNDVSPEISEKPIHPQPTKPVATELSDAYPNPFSNLTELSVTMDQSAMVSLHVYDAGGRDVEGLFDGVLAAGVHPFAFDGSKYPTGVYQCVLRLGNRLISKRLLISR